MTYLKVIASILSALFLASCSTIFGVQTVPEARMGYNESVTRSGNQQLLLNLVRLRYRDSATFLELSSVVTQYGYVGGLGANVSGELRNIRGATGGLNGSIAYEERPTIAYEPLQGSEFAQRMLTPIAPETIVLMSQSGWSIERLLLCCVEKLNNLSNGPSASGPTPQSFPDNRLFRQLAETLRNLQSSEVLSIDMQGTDQDSLTPTISFDLSRASQIGLADEVAHAKSLIGLPTSRNSFAITSSGVSRGSSEIHMKGRSLLGVLYALSHAVDVPTSDVERGLVTVSQGSQGESLSWRTDFLSDTFGIRASQSEPKNAFTKVFYRDNWFWIADNDLDAKTTFSLLRFLTALQSAAGEGATPLLTLSAGG